jgi:hypothetical protein
MQKITHKYNHEHQGEIAGRTGNHLGIRKIDRIYDKRRNQLVLMVKSSQMLDSDINAFVKGNYLVLEASSPLNYNKPLRTHLMVDEGPDNYEEDVSVISFSEIRLKPGYHYSVISCQLMNLGLIKIILNYTPSLFQTDHIKNFKKRNRK